MSIRLEFGVFEAVATGFSCSHACLHWTGDICTDTVRLNLLVTDNELLLALHLPGDDVVLLIPKLGKMSLKLVPLAKKYIGKGDERFPPYWG